MKKLLLICVLLTIFLGVTIGANAVFMWNAGTTREGSTGFVTIGILSETVTTFAGEHIFMNPIAYTKSLVGLKGFDKKEVVSMYASSQQLLQITNKLGPFSPELYKWTAPYAQMFWMYDLDYFFLIRREDADKIKSWSDLANKSVWPNTQGSGTHELVKVMLGPDGLNIYDTIDEKAIDISQIADALKLGIVDALAVFSGGGQIVSLGLDVLARTDSVILAPTPEELEKILPTAEYIFPATMSPDAYGQDVGLTETITNPALGFVYIVSPDVSEEIVYQAVKVAFEKGAEMAKTAVTWAKFAEDPWGYNLPYLQKYKKMGVPIHPGALRYFRELGHDTKMLGLE